MSGAQLSTNGCWTCKLRKKKCDKAFPTCEECNRLYIDCHHDAEKPNWMDGGTRQEGMTKRIRNQIRDNSHLRPVRGSGALHGGTSIPGPGSSTSFRAPHEVTNSINPCNPLDCTPDQGIASRLEAATRLSERVSHSTVTPSRPGIESADTVLAMFYLDRLLPFLFPFYNPSDAEGGKSWVLELMSSSSEVHHAILCQSTYFFALDRGTTSHDAVWEAVFARSKNAFAALVASLQATEPSPRNMVLAITSILQLQRFEIAIGNWTNWTAHLNAATALFRQLLSLSSSYNDSERNFSYGAAINALGPTLWVSSPEAIEVQSAEQAAFKFSSALLIFSDIIASTVSHCAPQLLDYHKSLLVDLTSREGRRPLVDLQPITGCKNDVLLAIGEIAALDAWKQECKRAGNLDITEVADRAARIKQSLQHHLTALEEDTQHVDGTSSSFLYTFAQYHFQWTYATTQQSSVIARVWGHAALLYLFVVVSGWQPASTDVRHHIGCIVEILRYRLSHPALLRLVAWPFCVAGCLAQPEMEDHFRSLFSLLQPPAFFETMRRALDIMEEVWHNREDIDRDIAACLKHRNDLILLV
ncbi:hypothetical protein K461DRAFT_326634 [Myriangium duriaei CBS 260.36]|uniref:Zn(2)-C6 fungal-type domain-containing protein n=1 Tax=Myriangium duriaei CBS 260.36 TaxID=1168546 RepID=A0A9P4J4A3_9PEZI|nr:hypothetical protein K461DRAFT_326634 [Myriangium duriaei CBS 260.36]